MSAAAAAVAAAVKSPNCAAVPSLLAVLKAAVSALAALILVRQLPAAMKAMFALLLALAGLQTHCLRCQALHQSRQLVGRLFSSPER